MHKLIKHFIEYSFRYLPLLLGLTLINLFTAPNNLWVIWVALFAFIGFFNELGYTNKTCTKKCQKCPHNDTW